ncbi:MAG: methyl-accepting chemotaxis protein [Alphaproteobacteria bacterium]
MSLQSAMGQFNVGTRIYAGFLVVLALLAVVAGVSYNGIGRIDDGFDDYASISDNTALNLTIDRNFTGLRRNMQGFATTGRESFAKRAGELEVRLEKDVGQSIEQTRNQERLANLKRIKELLAQYRTNRLKVVELRTKGDKILNEVAVPAGDEMAKLLGDLADKTEASRGWESGTPVRRVEVQVMRARLSVLRFVTSGDPKLVDVVKENIAASKKVLAATISSEESDFNRKVLETVQALLPKYEGAFSEMSAAILERSKIVDEVNAAIGGEIAKLLEATVASQRKAMDENFVETNALITDTKGLATTTSVVAAVAGLLAAWLIASGITGPVRAMTEAMTRLAGGDKTVSIPATGNRDEIGDMAKAVQVFKDNAIKVDRMAAEAEEQKKRAEIEKKKAMNDLADNFEASVKGIVNGVSSAATEMQATAQSMSAISEETSRQATTVAAAAEQASANVQTVSAAAEELSSSISEISRQVNQAARVSRSAMDEARRTDEMVQGLATAADRIGEVVKLINDIASQTNLLALNATIEAARAGDAGKGFAVVANEVKSLANQTGRATEEISQQIGAVQNATKDAVAAIQGITGTISEVSEISSNIASAVEEQGAATKEIARNVDQAAVGTQEVSKNISGVTSASEEAGQSANEVLGAAGELSRQSEHLRKEVDSFIGRIRAA